MAFDAGVIRAQAELDLAAFKQQMSQLEANVAAVNKTLAGVQPAVPQVDPEPAKAQINLLQKALQDLGQKFLGVKGTAQFDASDATTNVDGLTKSLGDLGGQLGIIKALGPLGAILGAGSIVAVAGAATVALAQLGAEFKGFQRTMQNAAGTTRAELDSLKGSFNTLFTALPVDGGALAQALPLISRRLHETGADLEATTGALVHFTRIMGGELAQNADLATRVFQGFGIAAQDQAAALDFVTKAAQQTGESAQALLVPLKELGPIARALGLSFEESTALIALFKERGLEAGDATRGLTAMLAKAAEVGISGREAFASLVKVIQDEPDAVKAADIATEAFGKRGAIVLAEMARSGDTDLQRFIDRMNGLPPALVPADTALARLQVAINDFRAALVPVGTAVFEFSTSVLGGLISQFDFVVRAIGKAAQAFPDLLGAALQGAAQSLTTFLDVLQTIATAIEGLIPEQTKQALGEVGTTAAAGFTAAQAQLAALNRELGINAKASQDAAGASATAAAGHDALSVSSEQAAANVAKLTAKSQSLTEQLAKLSDVGQIQVLLDTAEQTKVLDQAISTLTDKSIAAAIIAQRNYALSLGDTAEGYAAWDNAVQLATDHLAAQKATQEAATEAARKQAAEVKAIEDAMQKASTAASDQFGKRLEELANTIMPGLSNEMAIALKQSVLTGQTWDVLAAVAAALGISVEELTAKLQGTGQEFEATKKHADELTKSLDPTKLFADELARRAQDVLGKVADALSAGEAAALKHRASQVGAAEAVSEKLIGMGVDAGKMRDAMSAALAGSADDMKKFTQGAENVAQFLQTGVIPQVPKPPEDAWDHWVDAITKARDAFREAQEKTQDALRDAAQALEDQRQNVLDALDKAEADYQRTVDALEKQDQEATNKFNQASIDRGAKFDQAMDDILASQDKAIGTFLDAQDQANLDFTKTVTESSETAQKAIADLNEKNKQSTESANAAMQAAWKQSAQALEQLRQQQDALNLSLSRQLQDVAQKGLIGPQTQAQQNELALQKLKIQQDAALAQAGLTLQEQRAKGQFSDAVDAAEKQAKKQAEETAKALAKILEEQRKKEKQAADKRDKAIDTADKKLAETLEQLGKKLDEGARKFNEEQKKAKEAEKKRQEDLQKKRDEAERKRAEAEAKAAKDWDKADQQYDKRVRDIQREQDKAAREYQKAVTDANADLVRAVDALVKQGVELKTIMQKVLARQGIDMPVQFNNLTVRETGVDFLKVLVETGRTRLKEL